jgi:NO-binding membrane sensor protein with MHYT domain
VLGSGSLALGTGVWAMHFIGMLAFDLCTDVDYDPLATIISGVPSIAASFVALWLIARERLGGWGLLAGGVVVGAGIGVMHYAGMAGMRMGLALHYDPGCSCCRSWSRWCWRRWRCGCASACPACRAA